MRLLDTPICGERPTAGRQECLSGSDTWGADATQSYFNSRMPTFVTPHDA